MSDLAQSERSKVLTLEAMMKALPSCPEDVEEICPHKDHFSQGVYAREIFIPKGTILIGKIHKYQQLNIVLEGDLSVLTESGVKRVKAGLVVVSPPGTKRIAYAHEDTRWLTVHGTDLTDVDEIERQFIAQSEEEYLEFCKALPSIKQLEKTEG